MKQLQVCKVQCKNLDLKSPFSGGFVLRHNVEQRIAVGGDLHVQLPSDNLVDNVGDAISVINSEY